MDNQTKSHRSVERALGILKAFIPYNEPLGTGEISDLLGLHPSTVSRLAQVLTANGFLMQDPQTKKFTLGGIAAKMGRSIFQSLRGHLVVIAQPELDELSKQIGETIALEVASGNGTILAYKTRGSHRLQVSINLGERVPIHVAAGAKAVFAFSEPSLVNRLLNRDFERFTDNTILAPDVLLRQYEEIRKNGVSYDRGERDWDVHAMGAPIFNHVGKPVAAVVLAFPSTRADFYTGEETVSQLKKTARKISLMLHFSDETNEWLSAKPRDLANSRR